MGGDVQPLYLCPHPTSDARVKCILLKNSDQSTIELHRSALLLSGWDIVKTGKEIIESDEIYDRAENDEDWALKELADYLHRGRRSYRWLLDSVPGKAKDESESYRQLPDKVSSSVD